ncbi:hypothetical protein BGZ65_002888 [Modicella reniformis]|uniref:Uncharacterized protein n=1 Tax=Modicella reniformis TaxID=1440133 RepID=A0A9P6MLT6_9FUNG|nr:hypothetical protein BGZ65_002888 [Modicella reniformis]
MQLELLSVLAFILATASSITAQTALSGSHYANYTTLNLETQQSKSGDRLKPNGLNNRTPPINVGPLQCWHIVRSESVFSILCKGKRWNQFTDCSNGYRYTLGPLSGVIKTTIECPNKTIALRGGAFS